MLENVALLRCMDESIAGAGEIYDVPGLNTFQIHFGLAGSGVIRMGSGNQQVLPDYNRQLFLENQNYLLAAFSQMAAYMEAVFFVSSHVGCGWAGAQAIADVARETSEMCAREGVVYVGQIEYGNYPMQLGDAPVYANISRHPSQHRHDGRSVVVSVGGGASPRELADFERGRYGDAFLVSADFAAQAVAQGWMNAESAIRIVAVQLDLADGLADGRIGAGSMLPFDAGRLDSDSRGYNKWVFEQAVASLAR